MKWNYIQFAKLNLVVQEKNRYLLMYHILHNNDDN